MKELVFATNNKHKLEEVSQIAGLCFKILSLDDIGCHDDIPETADTLQGNALLKARHIWEKYGKPCFADDTGLSVTALGGEPGVHTARFAGEHCSSEDNITLLLAKLDGIADRSARFSTVIALCDENGVKTVEGHVDGSIALEKEGTGGFGYDPVFIPDESGVCFAKMDSGQKNAISHRGRAMRAFIKILRLNTPE